MDAAVSFFLHPSKAASVRCGCFRQCRASAYGHAFLSSTQFVSAAMNDTAILQCPAYGEAGACSARGQRQSFAALGKDVRVCCIVCAFRTVRERSGHGRRARPRLAFLFGAVQSRQRL